MVREHRLLTVKEGVNRIQFTWANTLIDPTSIEFRILDQQDKVDLVDTTFPAGRNDALQWNISSQLAGKIPVEIRYFTSGITWAADYVGIANEDETKLAVTGYVRVTSITPANFTTTPRRGSLSARSTSSRRSPTWRRPPPQWRGDAGRPDAATGFRPERRQGPRHRLPPRLRPWEEWAEGSVRQQLEAPRPSSRKAFPNISSSRSTAARTSRIKEPKRLVALKVAEVPLESIYKLSDRAGDTQLHQVLSLQKRQAARRKGPIG